MEKQILEYKGYIGSIEVSIADKCLYGKVQGLPRGCLISYEGQTIEELREDFEGAVDDYLEMCKDRGIELQKTLEYKRGSI